MTAVRLACEARRATPAGLTGAGERLTAPLAAAVDTSRTASFGTRSSPHNRGQMAGRVYLETTIPSAYASTRTTRAASIAVR